MERNNAGPGRMWYGVSLLIFVLSVGWSMALLVTDIIPALSGGTRFVAPGSTTIQVHSPSEYTLWVETWAFLDDRLYTCSATLPVDLNIKVYEFESGRIINTKPSLSPTESFAQTERKSIVDIFFDQPGPYRIEVNGDFSKRVFLTRRSLFPYATRYLAAFVMLSGIGWIGAPLMAAVVFMRRYRMRKSRNPKP